VRRRAHRQPRHRVERRDPCAAARRLQRVRPNDRDGDPRSTCGCNRRPDRLRPRRPHRGRSQRPSRGRRSADADGARRAVIRVTLKGLLSRKFRLFLTSLAVVLGAAMVSGTYVLTDTVNASLDALFANVYEHTDAVVTGEAVFGGDGNAPSFPASTLTRIQ